MIKMDELEFVTQQRRHLHAHRELSSQEYETTEYVAQFLEDIGMTYTRPLETGLITYLPGQSDRMIAYRADMDALPIFEENDVPYRSQNDNVMHACGHDGHTTALMLFVQRCKTLADQNLLPLNIVFIFQPAEETGGGANQLIQAGAFEQYDIEAVFGVHVMPFEEEGKVVIRDEEITASATEYRFYLNGLSSHVADKEQGHSCGEALQHVLTQVGQIQQYHLSGLKRNIVHMGRFEAGEAINTVPSHGYLEGTIRTYDQADLETVKTQMKKIADSVQLLFNVTCEVVFAEGYPPTYNASSLHPQVEQGLTRAHFEVIDKPTPYLFGEDFSFYSQLAPSYFVFVGTKDVEKGYVTGLHTSHLNFNEHMLIRIADYYEQLLFVMSEVDPS